MGVKSMGNFHQMTAFSDGWLDFALAINAKIERCGRLACPPLNLRLNCRRRVLTMSLLDAIANSAQTGGCNNGLV
jgi:hypothetical protein